MLQPQSRLMQRLMAARVAIGIVCLLGALGVAAYQKSAPAKPAAARPAKRYTMEQFLSTISVGGASFSADEKSILFHSNQTGIFNVYSVPVAGGAPAAMTHSTTDTTFAVSCFPTDARILYTHDQGGNELNHLYVRELDGKERDLTPGEKLKAQFAGWTHEGKAFYVLSNERDARYFDIYKYDAAAYARTMIYKDETGLEPGDISNDAKWIAFNKPKTTSDSDILLYNTSTKEMKKISEHTGVAGYSVAEFDPGSKWLYYTTDDGAEFSRVARYDLATGKKEDVEKAGWDIAFTEFSHNGKYRVTGINADGSTVIRIYDTKTGEQVPLPKLPGGDIAAVTISRSEQRMAFYLNGDRSPSNLYVYDFGTKQATRLTDTLSKQIDPADLVDSEVVRFPSFDKMTIPAIFFKPHDATPQHRAPALVWVHGGPGGQTRKGYSATIQYLVNHGYVVLGINNRGSSGYGKTFFRADDKKHGHEPLWDCVEAKKYLASLPYVDANRIGIIGGSYGGYMVLAALSLQPDVFDVGVDLFGISNWIRTLESIPPWWESQREALYTEIGDPQKDREMLREISPLFHSDKIKKPLMVLQGANDPRVIKPESDDIVAAVKKNNVPVEYVLFPDEGHGFTKKKNQIEGYSKILEFLDKYLKSAPGGSATGTQN